MNNRPTYAPERRPGDKLNDVAGTDLVVIAFARDDVATIAALLETGGAALKYAPASANIVELNSRRRDWRLGVEVAAAMRQEEQRLRAKAQPRPHRRAPRARRTVDATTKATEKGPK